MIVVWTAISYSAYGSVPAGIPRRLSSPNPWATGASSNWAVIKVIGSPFILRIIVNLLVFI